MKKWKKLKYNLKLILFHNPEKPNENFFSRKYNPNGFTFSIYLNLKWKYIYIWEGEKGKDSELSYILK